MNSRSFITFWMVVFGIIVVAGLISAFLVIEYGNYTRHEVSLLPEEDMELVDSYDIDAQPYTRHTVYVYHDNDRNITCYLYDDGISCIPDWFFEVVEK